MAITVTHGHDDSGTTTTRSTTADAGKTFYNSTTGGLQVYTGSAWQDAGSASGSFAVSGGSSIAIDNTFTLATAGVHKGITSTVTYTPATSGLGTSIGVAGKAVLNGTFTGGQGLMFGIQGQMDFTTDATINNSSSIFSALRGVITAAGSPTFTAGDVCGLYIDNLVTNEMAASSGDISLIRIANHGNGSSRSTIDSAIYVYGVKVTNLFEFNSAIGGGGFVSAFGGTAHGGTIKKVAVTIDGSTYFLLASTAPA